MPYYVIVNNASYVIECQEADQATDPWVEVNGANARQMFPNTVVLELRHPRCVFKIRCGQGSQNTTNYIVYITAELHVSAYIEAIFRFVIASSEIWGLGPDVEIS